MEPSNDIVRLLSEIRDLERENSARYEAWHRQNMELSEAASRMQDAANQRALAQGRTQTWLLLWLIAITIGVNLYVLVHLVRAR